MRRYLRDFHLGGLKIVKTDVLIVGTGIAGLWTALHLLPKMNCTVICKHRFENSNSWLAQGGVAAVFDKNDTFSSHIKDTLVAGAGLCDEEVVDILVREAPENIRELMYAGVIFDKDENGILHMGREGGHSCRRILHSGGDATGRAITHTLLKRIKEKNNVRLLPQTRIVEVFTNEQGILGALLESGCEYFAVETPHIVLATGGIGQIYQHTTNPGGAIGDGIATAIRAGVEVKHMEMVQFHPTTLVNSKNSDRTFLISEAVRGEGAILRNQNGEAFMSEVHPMKDLAPRDIVTRGILKELKSTGDAFVNLDVSSMSTSFFAQRFPTIFAKCEISGIHLTHDDIPVHPAQHYFMGGIATDKNGATNIPGLWAVGECACNGVHGANRLASNSMLECLVFGKRCASAIETGKRKISALPIFAYENPETSLDEKKILQMQVALKYLMENSLGPVRTKKGIKEAVEQIDGMLETMEKVSLSNDFAADLYSMLIISKSVAECALHRESSVGAHYLEDESI